MGARSGDGASADPVDPPLEWMIAGDDVGRRADQLGDAPGPARLLAAALGLADDDESAHLVGWLGHVAARATTRGDAHGARLALHLRASIEEGRDVVGDAEAPSGVPSAGSVVPADGGVPSLVVSEAAVQAARRYIGTGHVTEGISSLQAALSAAHVEQSDGIEAALLPFLAHAHVAVGDNARAEVLLRRADEVRARLTPPEAAAAGRVAQAVDPSRPLGDWRGSGPNVVDRARARIVEARAAESDPEVAAVLAATAAEDLAHGGALRWQVEALLCLAEHQAGDAAAATLSDAYRLSGGGTRPDHGVDPAFEPLWAVRPPMRVELLGGKRITVGDEELQLGERADQLFISVLTAGPPGAHWETVASWLWPDETDLGKLKSRVSSTTNLTRKALGAEAWRLERDGPLLRVLRLGLTLDLDEEREVLRAGGAIDVDVAVLPPWSEMEWVEDLEVQRDVWLGEEGVRRRSAPGA